MRPLYGRHGPAHTESTLETSMRQLNFEFEIVALNKKDFGIRIYSSDAQKEIPDSHNVTPSYPILNQFLYVESSMFYIREVRFF